MPEEYALLRISEVAGRYLDNWAHGYQMGEIPIHRLPPQVQQFVSIGWAEAMQIVKRERREYEHRLDLAYINMLHPKERAAEIQRRMQEHFQREEERFFAEAPQLPDIPDQRGVAAWQQPQIWHNCQPGTRPRHTSILRL